MVGKELSSIPIWAEVTGLFKGEQGVLPVKNDKELVSVNVTWPVESASWQLWKWGSPHSQREVLLLLMIIFQKYGSQVLEKETHEF